MTSDPYRTSQIDKCPACADRKRRQLQLWSVLADRVLIAGAPLALAMLAITTFSAVFSHLSGEPVGRNALWGFAVSAAGSTFILLVITFVIVLDYSNRCRVIGCDRSISTSVCDQHVKRS